MFACNDFCYDVLTDPFTGELIGPRPPCLVWLDDICRCGTALEGYRQITGKCEVCESAPLCSEE